MVALVCGFGCIVAAEGIVFIVPEPAHCRSGLDSPALTLLR
jgi:hypothetical protein